MTTKSVSDRQPRRKRVSRGLPEGFAFDVCNTVLMILVIIVTLYPFLYLLAYSFNDAVDSLKGNIHIWPRVFTTYNYTELLKDQQILQATLISVLRTVIGCLASVCCCIMVAYALSRREFVLRRFIGGVLVMTMYFSGGLIPYYLLMKSVKLVGTFWIYILPGLFSAWNIMIIKSFIMTTIPESLLESAKIDGASEFRVLLRIVAPLSLPVLATVLLWIGVGQWNSWFDVYIYNGSKPALSTLQFELQKMLQRTLATSVQNKVHATGAVNQQTTTPQAVRAAMTIVATLPILMAYPFLQRYFITGLTLGGVKE